MSGVLMRCSNCGQVQCPRNAPVPTTITCALWCPPGCLLPMEERGFREDEMVGVPASQPAWSVRLADVWDKRRKGLTP